jgi:hypothetical protein
MRAKDGSKNTKLHRMISQDGSKNTKLHRMIRNLITKATTAFDNRRRVTRNKNRSPVIMRLRVQMLTPASARCS